MTKIAFIGAGSLEVTGELVQDILTFPLLQDAPGPLGLPIKRDLHYEPKSL